MANRSTTAKLLWLKLFCIVKDDTSHVMSEAYRSRVTVIAVVDEVDLVGQVWRFFARPCGQRCDCDGVVIFTVSFAACSLESASVLKQTWHCRQTVYARGTQSGVTCSEGRTRNCVCEIAWGCGSGKTVRAMSWREFWNVQKKIFQGVTTCHDKIVVPLSCHFREQFVNFEQTRRNYWVTTHADACRDVNMLKFSPRPCTHYTCLLTHPDAHCHEVIPLWHAKLLLCKRFRSWDLRYLANACTCHS